MARTIMVASEKILIKYQGENVDGGRINAYDLSVSVLGLVGLLRAIQDADPELRREETPALEVRAHGEGSFELSLALMAAATFWDQVKIFANGEDARAIRNLTQLLRTSWDVLRLVSQGFGPSSKNMTTENNGMVTVQRPDGGSITIPSETFLAMKSPAAMESAAHFVEPLRRDGVDQVSISSSETDPLTIDQTSVELFDDAAQFDEPSEDPEFDDVWCTFNSVDFAQGKRMKFNDGVASWTATVEDDDFLDAVASGEIAFSASTSGRLVVRTERWKTKTGYRTRRFVMRVRRVRSAGASFDIWVHPLEGAGA